MLISVIIPVYNKEKYIDQCIYSAIKQTYRNIEIIIINDGSNDNSNKLIEKWALEDSRIRYFRQKNRGVAKTRNTGLQYAKGDYVYFLDADDYIMGDALYNFVNNNKEVKADIVIGNYYEKKNNDLYKKSLYKQKVYKPAELKRIETKIDMFIDKGRAMAMAGNKLYKLSFLNNISVTFQHDIISEDRLFNLICYVNNPTILLINEYTYVYNIIEDSRSRDIKPSFYTESISLFFSFHDYLNNNSQLKIYHDLLQLILIFDIYKIINTTYKKSKNPIRDTNNIINKMKKNNLIITYVSNIHKRGKIKRISGYKLFNHMLVVSYLFLYAPKVILSYKFIVSLKDTIKKI